MSLLSHHVQSSTALDLIADVLIRDNNASDGGIAGLTVATVNQELASSTHVIGSSGVQVYNTYTHKKWNALALRVTHCTNRGRTCR